MSSQGVSTASLTSHSTPTEIDQTRPAQSCASSPTEHNRHEVQAFGFTKDIHQPQLFQTEVAFLATLRVPEDHLQCKPSDQRQPKFTFDSFLKAANALSRSMKEKHFAQHDLLVWKDTGDKIPRGHVTDTACKPDITVAFDKHFGGGDTTLWPCIHLAGERASKGQSREDQEKQAISYLHFLLLARPDLYVAQGILTSKKKVTFFLGIGGFGIRSFKIKWTSRRFYKLMYAFVYRLYQPDHFADPSYKKMEPDFTRNFVTYTIGITTTTDTKSDAAVEVEVDCPGLQPIYASNPFETRTHVLSNPQSQVEVNGQVLAVVKDQFCHVRTRFNEQDILDHIHKPAKVPGVVEMVYHKTINLPHLEGLDKQVDGVKHRLGMRQVGMPFASISTLEEVLRTAFDLLEVLRFLRVERQILHRDISRGNVMYISPKTPAPTGNVEPANKKHLQFVRYILGESQDPHETSLLLVDFNHAEHLSSNQSPEHNRVIRIGTPIFIARAVELGCAVRFEICKLSAIPNIPANYAKCYPDREEMFPTEDDQILLQPSADSKGRPWRHELDHDAESVFWLVLYWSMTVQPKGHPAEPIRAADWANLLGDANHRNGLVYRLAEDSPAGCTAVHSVYRPLLLLLHHLAEILRVDRYWLDKKNTRNHTEYVPEAFQRLILQFLVDHHDKDFMKCEVTSQPREVSVLPRAQSLPCTTSQKRNAENVKKRSSAETLEEEQPPRKRSRLPPTASEVVPEDDSDEDEDSDEDKDISSEAEE